MESTITASGPRIPARRRRRLIARREQRHAERALKRAHRQLTDFVMLWSEGALDTRPYHEFMRRRDALVQRYRAAQRHLFVLTGELEPTL